MLFTLGHSNLPRERFVEILHKHRIEIVIDVRSQPYSRFNDQFDRPSLARAVQASGMAYTWGGRHLGGRNTLSIKSKKFIEKMQRVMELAEDQNVALVCSEADPKTCHRAMKLTAWVHVDYPDMTALHIMKDGSLVASRMVQKFIPKKEMWWEFGGEYGLPKGKAPSSQLKLDI